MRIGDLLLKYDTDKNRGVTDLKNGHCYGDSYQEIFNKYDKDHRNKILEIGVQKGGSLLAWKDYFQNSFVLGIDILDVRKEEYKRDDVNFILSDIKNPDLKFNSHISDNLFDIIIDDGSHFLEDVVYVVDNYSEKLNKNGHLIIEDVQYPELWYNVISSRIDSNLYEISAVDLRNINGYYDDFLILIKRK